MAYKDLKVWTKSMALVTDVYQCTAGFPASEQYGLTAQMRRSAVSIPSNLAEGSRRLSHREFRQFIRIALGSAAELETQIHIAFNLKYVPDDLYQRAQVQIDEILRMLGKLEFNLRSRP